MKVKLLLTTLFLWTALYMNMVCAQSITDTIFDRYADTTFAFGADISWLSQQESWGTVYKDKYGVQKNLMVILKEQGINALRFRVWVNPGGGWSGKNDVVYLAKRANNMGFKVMIDFHYSDSWADPGKQYKPAAWANHTFAQLVDDVYNHTYEILDTLKKAGVTPAWVQIGNETKRGMLWPDGNTDNTNGMSNFAKLINSGYDAIKAIDSSIMAIVHLPDADENSLYRWMFDGLKNNGAKWDIIGMSAYPRWSHLEWKTEIELAVANMKDMIFRYNTKVMIVETGHYWHKPYEANNFLVELMDTMMTIGGLGAFYWEPEAISGYELGAWDPATKQPTVAMDAFLGIKHTDPSTLIHVSLDEPSNNAVYDLDQAIRMTASASHLNGTISKVTFFVNKNPVANVTTEPYTFEMPNPGVGIYNISATATDSNGAVANSETITILVGPIAIFQENTNGYCGITNNAGTIDTNHPNYTGTGFINTDNLLGCTVNWTVNFKDTGKYIIQFRYASTSARPGTVKINGKTVGTASFLSTGTWDVWDFSSVNYTVINTGSVPISLTSTTTAGLPNIDYISITSLESTNKVESSSVCLDPSTSINTDKSIDKLTIYPVPAKNVVLVKSPRHIDIINIYTMEGVMMKSINNINNFQAEIHCNDLNSGLYIIQTTVGKRSYVNKFSILK